MIPEKQLIEAVETMRELIPFFPKGEASTGPLVVVLDRMVDTPEHLAVLVDAACQKMRTWSGLAELRGLYCALGFEPADGIREACTLPGFTAADREREYFERESRATLERIEAWKREKLLAEPGTYFEAPELPEAKRIADASEYLLARSLEDFDRNWQDLVAACRPAGVPIELGRNPDGSYGELDRFRRGPVTAEEAREAEKLLALRVKVLNL